MKSENDIRKGTQLTSLLLNCCDFNDVDKNGYPKFNDRKFQNLSLAELKAQGGKLLYSSPSHRTILNFANLSFQSFSKVDNETDDDIFPEPQFFSEPVQSGESTPSSNDSQKYPETKLDEIFQGMRLVEEDFHLIEDNNSDDNQKTVEHGNKVMEEESHLSARNSLTVNDGMSECVDTDVSHHSPALARAAAIIMKAYRKYKCRHSLDAMYWLRVIPLLQMMKDTTDASVIIEALTVCSHIQVSVLAVDTLSRLGEIINSSDHSKQWIQNIPIPLLCRCVGTYEDNISAASHGSLLLLTFSLQKSKALRHRRVLATTLLVQSGACEILSSVLVRYCSSALHDRSVLLRIVCAGLIVLSDHSVATRSRLGSSSLFRTIVTALGVHKHVRQATNSLLRLILSLCRDCRRNRDLAGQEGVCGALQNCLVTNHRDSEVVQLICKAVMSVCADDHKDNQRLLSNKEVCRIILDCLEIHSLNLAVVKKLCTITVCITLSSSYCKSIFVEAGLVDEVLRILVTPRVSRQIALLGMWVIGCLGMPESSTMAQCLQLLSSEDEIVKYDLLVLRRLYLCPACHLTGKYATAIGMVGLVFPNVDLRKIES